jgi:parallel beta-helix repeat protein
MHKTISIVASASDRADVRNHAVTLGAASKRSPFLAAILATALLAAAPVPASALTKTVCPTGCQYTSITGAINSLTFPLTDSVTINVGAGTYRERVRLFNKDGASAARRFIIQAVGAATIDGSDDFTGTNMWVADDINPSVYSADISNTPMAPPSSQVFVNDERYLYTTANYWTMGSHRYTIYNGILYVNAGGSNPGSWPTFVGNNSRKWGFDIGDTDYLTIDGFTVARCDEEGINIRGTGGTPADTNLRAVIVKNCTSKQNWLRGIFFRNCAECLISNNTTFSNGGYGIYFNIGTRSAILGNTSYLNDKPDSVWAGVAGIKVGDSGDSNMVSFVTVDYNRVHDNEDSGIDLKGAKHILVRRNVSYGNGDHGYDNNGTKHTWFINDVASGNDHDGISIENTASAVEVYNCILAYNTLDATTLATNENVAELWVKGTGAFVSDHNMIVGTRPYGNIWGNGSRLRGLTQWGSVLDTSLVAWQSSSSEDAHSRSSDPLFTDGANGNFIVNAATSESVERAKTNMVADPAGWASPWWLATDPRGFVPNDNDSIPNSGDGSPNYADIGAYEYDAKPAAMTDLRADVVTDSSVHLLWTASGDDGMVGTATSVDLRWSETGITEATFGSATAVSPQPSPGNPGATQGYLFSVLPMCTLYYYGLKYGDDENGLKGDLGDTVRVVTNPVWHNGQWVCDEGLGAPLLSSARRESAWRATVTSVATLGGTMAKPELQAGSGGGGPLVVEMAPSGNGLDVRLVALRSEEAAGYGASGVVYQVPDRAGVWGTRLRYDLPRGSAWAVLPSVRKGRWVFVESLRIQGVNSSLIVDGVSWQLEQAHHSRIGDVTAMTGADQPPTLTPGDTLTVVYRRNAAEADSPPSWLVFMDKPAGDAAPTGARGPAIDNSMPTEFSLQQNHPNPFVAKTTFRFDLPQPQAVRLEVYDLMGRRVAVLRNAWTPAGRHSLDWDGRNGSGSRARPGTYLCRLAAGSFRAERKLVILP